MARLERCDMAPSWLYQHVATCGYMWLHYGSTPLTGGATSYPIYLILYFTELEVPVWSNIGTCRVEHYTAICGKGYQAQVLSCYNSNSCSQEVRYHSCHKDHGNHTYHSYHSYHRYHSYHSYHSYHKYHSYHSCIVTIP